ncbi:hypothetical protein [Blastopirellula retiformator]|uniref:Uncharacterized protein n=1 Tax=Blastopirellula retiformator TaxID=2527970 RepID=A0A5C5VII5_9BACT|nr:hypothetical protein [Blastopirellula retiformator]TWT38454.1 hypothetical protein Enr8_01460 [Blastopirellula retiformator]
MQPIPPNLLGSLPPNLAADASRWWDSLSDDARKEIFLFETFSEEHADLVTGGKFLPHDDAEQRTFHIGCSQHPAARACLAKGEIAADFACPFADGDCRMRKILGSRKIVALRPLAQQS